MTERASRRAIFDTVREARGGRGFSMDDVVSLDLVLDRLGVPRDGNARTMDDIEAFFAGIRKVTGPLNQMQVDIVNSVLRCAAHWPVAWLAYGLATAWHEARLEPIEEIGKGKGRKYAVAGKHGQVAYGRGLVQLTWDYNYERADRELGLGGTLTRDYSRALDPDIATAILVRGMGEGWFTGKKLADYLPAERGTEAQFTAARRIINGTDRAVMIAGHAMQFQNAAIAGEWK